MTPRASSNRSTRGRRRGQARPVAVVTGGAIRVGRAIALAFGQAGYDLVLTYRTSRAEVRRTAAACERHGVSTEAVELDLADARGVESFALDLARRFPRIDALVHNASSYGPTPFGSLTEAEALEHYRVNALSPVLLTQALRQPLTAARGSVIFFGDIHVMGRPRKRFLAYSLAKAATVEAVLVLAREMAPNVRVNGIAPGVVAWPEDTDPAEIAAYEKRIPLERSGTPEDAARVVLFLARDATYLTGEIVRVDGGRFLT